MDYVLVMLWATLIGSVATNLLVGVCCIVIAVLQVRFLKNLQTAIVEVKQMINSPETTKVVVDGVLKELTTNPEVGRAIATSVVNYLSPVMADHGQRVGDGIEAMAESLFARIKGMVGGQKKAAQDQAGGQMFKILKDKNMNIMEKGMALGFGLASMPAEAGGEAVAADVAASQVPPVP